MSRVPACVRELDDRLNGMVATAENRSDAATLDRALDLKLRMKRSLDGLSGQQLEAQTRELLQQLDSAH